MIAIRLNAHKDNIGIYLYYAPQKELVRGAI